MRGVRPVASLAVVSVAASIGAAELPGPVVLAAPVRAVAGAPAASSVARTSRPGFDVAPLVKPAAVRSQAAPAPAVRGFDARYSRVVDADTTPTSEFFRNADGSGTAVISSAPVRFKGRDGAWHGIDPTLVPDVDGSLRPRSVQAVSRIVLDHGEPAVTVPTPAGDIEVRHTGLPADLGHPLRPVPGKGIPAGTAAAVAAVTDTRASLATSGGVQVRYDMGANGFTDDVVVPSARGGSSFTVTMTLPKGVKASQGGDAVVFTDATGTTVASYAGGIAYDATAAAVGPDLDTAAAGSFTPVRVTLVNHGIGAAVVRVSIDPTWLADTSRVFPVVIDPTFNSGTAKSTTGLDDTYISSDCQIYPACLQVQGGANAGQYYVALHFLREGNKTGAGTARAMIPFDDVWNYNPPPGWSWTLTSGSSAQLHVYSTEGATCDLPTDIEVLDSTWDPYNIVWGTNEPSFSPPTNSTPENTTVGLWTWTTFNVTGAIDAKYGLDAGRWYGIALVPDPEHLYSQDCYYDWASADWPTHPEDAPYLTINFTKTSSSAPPAIGFTDVGNQWAHPPYADPVDVVTGGLKDSFTDLASPTDVYGLGWGRTYNLYDAEQNVSPGGLGRGWSSTFYPTIAAATDGSGDVVLTGPDGRQVTWTPDGSGGFTRPYQYAADLSVVNGDYRVSFDGGSYWDFDDLGRLAAMTSANGQQQAVVNWTASGQIDTVTTSTTGQSPVTLGTLTFSYGTSGNGAGKITSVSGPTGTVGYGYDSSGNLTSVTDVSGNVTTYTYDSANRLRSLLDPTGVVQMFNTFNSSGQVATQQHPAGATTTFSYGSADSSTWTTTVSDSETGSAGQSTYFWQAPNNNKQVTQIEDNLPNPDGGTGNSATQTFGNAPPDTLGDLTTATSRLGGQNTLTYDDTNRVTCDAQPGGVCPAQGAAIDSGSGPYTGYGYDSSGRITQKYINGQGSYLYTYTGTDRLPSTMTDPSGAVTNYTITNGLMMSQIDPDGVVTDYTYDAAGRVLTKTVDGDTTSYTYDAAGRQTCVALPGGVCPDANGNGGSGDYTTASYYPSGLVHTKRAADGGITSYTYDTDGRVLTVTDPTGAVMTNHYDPSTGLLTSVDRPGQIVGGVQQYLTTHYGYDADGNQTCVAPPGGVCPDANGSGGTEPYTLTVYGPLARVTSTTNALGQTTSYGYDADGNKVATDNPDGSAVYAAYDAAGHLYCTTVPGAPGQNSCPDLNGNGGTGRYTITRYDTFGRVSCVAQPGGDCVAGTGPITTYTYDSLGRQHTVTDVNGGTTTTTYTPGGRRYQAMGPDGGVTTYAYDAAGRTSSVTDPDGNAAATTYTPQGWVASSTDATGLTTSYTYDAVGRQATITAPDGVVTHRTYTLRGELQTQQVGTDGQVSYTYNGDGSVASVTDALGNTTTYTYDDRGNRSVRTDVAGGTQTSGYNNANELVSQADQLNRSTVTTYYDDATNGHKTVTSDPSGRTTTTVMNPDGTVASTAYSGSAGSLTYTYGYDTLGHLSTIDAPDGTWAYAYSTAGQLTSETTPGGATTSWDYDAAGRRLLMTYPDGTTVDYSYDPAGRLTQQTTTPAGGGAQSTTYTYNADGQLTHVTLPDGSRSYSYGTSGTSAGKVVSYTQDLPGATQTATLSYDANGRLHTLTTNTGTGGGGGATVSSAPLGVSASAGDGQAVVAWSAPSSDGGSPVTGYTVTASPGGASATTTGAVSVVVAGLTNGVAYTFTVYATNAVGDGPESAASNAATPSSSGGGGITPVAHALTEVGSGSSIAVAMPSGLADGQVVVVSVATSDDGAGIVAPAGWTLIDSKTSAAPDTVAGYYHVVSDAASEPASYTWSGMAAGSPISAVAESYAGVDTTTPLDTAVADVAGGTGTLTLPSLATADDGALLVSACVIQARSAASITVPLAMTQVDQTTGTGRRLAYARLAIPTAGATGDQAWTMSQALHGAAFMVALKPATAGGGSVPAVDGSSPAAVTGFGHTTTASFTPPAGSLLVAVGDGDGSSFPGYTISDSAGLTWHELVSQAPAGLAPQAIWVADVTTSTAMTVEVANSGSGYPYVGLQVLVLDGAAPAAQQTGTAGAASQGGTDAAITLTPTSASSLVVGTLDAWSDAHPDGPLADTTTVGNPDGSGGPSMFFFTSAGATGTTSPTAYGYSIASNPNGIVWDLTAAEILPNTTGGGSGSVTTTYGYDAAGQLVSVSSSDGSTTAYTYDSLGHRATATTNGVLTTYRYDAAGELCWSVVGASSNDCGSPPAGATTYSYDAAGRLLSQTADASDATSYGYDPAGRLTSLQLVSGSYDTTQTRAYNPTGDLVSATNTGTSTTSTTLGWDDAASLPTLATLATGGAGTDLVTGAGQWATASAGGVVSGIGVDAFGSVVPTLDTPGLAAGSGYDAWGNPTGSGPSLEPGLGYRGELQFGDSVDLRARSYDTTLGAFTSTDPLDGVNGTTTIAGLYPYANNNPIANADPTGRHSADWADFLRYVNTARAFTNIAPQLAQNLSTVACGSSCYGPSTPYNELAQCVTYSYRLFQGWQANQTIEGTIKADCTGAVPLPAGLPDVSEGPWWESILLSAPLLLIPAVGEEVAAADAAGAADAVDGALEDVEGVAGGGRGTSDLALGLTGGTFSAQELDTLWATEAELAAEDGIPQAAKDALQGIDDGTWPPPGVKGGSSFANDGRAGGQVLPRTDPSGSPVTYQEWDVNPKGPTGRDAIRIVTGSDGSAWYTDDHYGTFTRIR